MNKDQSAIENPGLSQYEVNYLRYHFNNKGWICPVCNAGISPAVMSCPHPLMDQKITMTSSSGAKVHE